MPTDTRPTLLVFAGHYLPGYKAGGILRSVTNAVSHLHGEFRFLIVTRDRDLGDTRAYPGIRHEHWQDVGNASVYYLPPGRQSMSRLRRIITSTPHDLLRLNSFFDPLTVKVLLNLKTGQIPKKPVVLSPFGEFAWPSLRQKYPKKFVFICAARLMGLYSPVIWHASNPVEGEEIRRVMGIGMSAIRVAADLPTIWESSAPPGTPAPPRDGLRVAFFSRISPEKNLDFALAVLARVRAKVQFDIIGPAEKADYWAKCQKLIDELPANVAARSLGGIKPEDVFATLSQYDLMLLPTGGEAYGHVISESLTAGTPVLISTRTPWRDLESRGLGWDLPLDDPAPFVQVIEQLAASTADELYRRRARVTEAMQEFLRRSPSADEHRRMLQEALTRPR